MKNFILTMLVALFTWATALSQTIRLNLKSDKTDQTATIQKAINDARGTTLIIPDDTFYVKNLVGISDVSLVGEGHAMFKYFKSPTVEPGSILRFNGARNFRVDNITMDGQLVPFGTALQVLYSSDFTISNNTIQNNFGEAIVIAQCKNAYLDNNKELLTDVGVLLSGGNFNIEVNNNLADGGTSDGIHIFGDGDSTFDSHIVIQNSKSYNKTGGNGFGLRYCRYVVLTNNYAENCMAGVGAEETPVLVQFVKVANNRFYNCGKAVVGPFDFSIFSGNMIEGCIYGIWVGSTVDKYISHNNIITENMLKNTQAAMFFPKNIGSVIDKNVVSDTNKKTYTGINLQNGEGNIVTNNSIQYAQFPILVLKSNSNIITQNKGTVINQGLLNTLVNNVK